MRIVDEAAGKSMKSGYDTTYKTYGIQFLRKRIKRILYPKQDVGEEDVKIDTRWQGRRTRERREDRQAHIHRTTRGRRIIKICIRCNTLQHNLTKN